MLSFMEDSGFCDGVRHAVKSAEQLHEHILAKKKVFLYGDLVNNAHVMRSFSDKGFCYADPDDPAAIDLIPEGAIVVIRTHGIPREAEEKLIAKNLIIKDYTCGRVKKIHNIVKEKSSSGYKVIVVGSKCHPEVIGISGWCVGAAHIVAHETDLEGIDLSGKVCVVAQTTCEIELWNDITSLILSKNPAAEINNTLCGVIAHREKAAKEIAALVDFMFVVGDSESSNSKRLYNECRTANQNTFPITSLFPLHPTPEKPPFVASLMEMEKRAKIINDISSVGLTASASVPDEVIYELCDYLLFKEFFMRAKKEIEAASAEYFDDYRMVAADNALVQLSLKSLREQHEGGKRIRGAMIKLGEQIASCGQSDKYLPIAVGYELFQTSVLIHDDIIDKSDTRRKKATIHAESEKKIQNISHISDIAARHYGISRALCIGDYGFFISYQFLSKCKIETAALANVYSIYSKILALTCEGEIMDSLLPFEKASVLNNLDNYEEYERIVRQIYEYKTAWYTLAGPIMLGAVCGGANDELLELLKDIAIPLGIAFQIKDDLLGIYSNEEILGKSVLSDICENKQTLMFGFACKNADERQKILLDRHYGKKSANEHDLEIIRSLFEATGAKKYAEDEIRHLSNAAKALIKNDLIDSKYQSILNGLTAYLIGRNS